MGYDLEEFVNSVNEELICSVCQGVFKEPMITPCDHTFCDECIRIAVQTIKACPMDRIRLRVCNLKPASRTVKNIINGLEVRCQFYQEGCTKTSTLESLHWHVESCEYNPELRFPCRTWCRRMMSKRELFEHNCQEELLKHLHLVEQDHQQLVREQRFFHFIIVILFFFYIFLPFESLVSFFQNS